MLCLSRNSTICSCTILSSTFDISRRREIGRQFLGSVLEPFLKSGLNFAILQALGNLPEKLTDCIAVLLAWLIMMHRLLEKFLKDHRCLEPYFHQNFLVFRIPYPNQFLQIVTFPSNYISCNSYSLIVFQNYSEVLVVLTQGFPLMRSNIFKKFLLLTVSRMINHFCFLNIYSMENSFCPAALVVLKFAKVLLVQLYFLTISPQNTVFSSV